MTDDVCLPDIVIIPIAVLNKIRTLNPTKSECHDIISPRILLDLQKFLYIPMIILFNNCIEKGCIPHNWKMQK